MLIIYRVSASLNLPFTVDYLYYRSIYKCFMEKKMEIFCFMVLNILHPDFGF